MNKDSSSNKPWDATRFARVLLDIHSNTGKMATCHSQVQILLI